MPSGNLAAAAAYFGMIAADMERTQKEGLEKAAQIVEKAAKQAIGDPDNGYGWAPLAPSTLARKAANTPLLETGELQGSIAHVVEGNKATIGTADKVGVFHELGTSRMAPRPFLYPSAIRNIDEIKKAIGEAVVAALTGRSP